MTDASPGYRATEHGYDVILNQQVSEALGAISTGESDHISGEAGQLVRKNSARAIMSASL
jgi:hypothetical protein